MRSYKKSDKIRIENYVRNYLKALLDELYLELNEGVVSGLCEHGSFESDLSRCIFLKYFSILLQTSVRLSKTYRCFRKTSAKN